MLPDFPKLRKEMSSHLMLKLHAMVQEKEPILADIRGITQHEGDIIAYDQLTGEGVRIVTEGFKEVQSAFVTRFEDVPGLVGERRIRSWLELLTTLLAISVRVSARQINIIVVGGSAGALTFLQEIVKDFPVNFQAAICVALHVSPDAPSLLAEIVNRSGPLLAAFAEDEEKIVSSRIYIAPPDRHLLVYDGSVHLTRDPRENRSRPAIDPLFRSAARWYGPVA